MIFFVSFPLLWAYALLFVVAATRRFNRKQTETFKRPHVLNPSKHSQNTVKLCALVCTECKICFAKTNPKQKRIWQQFNNFIFFSLFAFSLSLFLSVSFSHPVFRFVSIMLQAFLVEMIRRFLVCKKKNSIGRIHAQI